MRKLKNLEGSKIIFKCKSQIENQVQNQNATTKLRCRSKL